jgi:hypothetical protein
METVGRVFLVMGTAERKPQTGISLNLLFGRQKGGLCG